VLESTKIFDSVTSVNHRCIIKVYKYTYTRWGIITGPHWFLLYSSIWTNRQKADKIYQKCLVHYLNNILNYWLSLCSKCPPFASTHAWIRVRHCLTAVSITRWSSSSQAVRIRERSSSTSLIRPLAILHAALSRELVVGIFMPKTAQ